ncbi:MAG: prepilin-type N-terminal cleavage/methylation domain-containing protein [Luteolibacter sp.]
MKPVSNPHRQGFTLMETVIAIGVLAVLLTGFVAVFAPATGGIKRSISSQEADRLASALEQQMSLNNAYETSTTTSSTTITTAFEKAFEWVIDSPKPDKALLAYQYRAHISKKRIDGTGEPYTGLKGQAGKDYILQPMVRRIGDKETSEDIAAVEGNVFVVKCRPLVFENNRQSGSGIRGDQPGSGLRAGGGLSTGGGLGINSDLRTARPVSGDGGSGRGTFDLTMKPATRQEFENSDGTVATNPESFKEGVMCFEASFYPLPSRTPGYLKSEAFKRSFPNLNSPVMVRNFAITR